VTTDQRHRFVSNGTAYLPWNIQVAAIFFAGSKKPSTSRRSSIHSVAALAAGWTRLAAVLPENGERALKNDYKLDLSHRCESYASPTPFAVPLQPPNDQARNGVWPTLQWTPEKQS
jgi:hypothetical protein